MSNSIQVVIPVFNEAESIGEVIKKLKELELNIDIFVIDDGSTDGTDKIAEDLGAILIKHPLNLGGGAAIRTGFQIALLNNVDYVVTLDGDGQHDPKELPYLIRVMEKEKAGLLIGSRFLGNNTINMAVYRSFGIRFFSWLISKIINQKITDATSCYRIYDMNLIKKIINNLNENQYYALEIILELALKNIKIIEISVSSIERKKGYSKKGIIKYFYNLLRVIFNY